MTRKFLPLFISKTIDDNWTPVDPTKKQSHVQQNSRNEKKSSQNQKRRGDDNNKTPVEDPAGSNKSSISVQKNSKNEKKSPQKNRTKNDNNCEEQRSKTTPQQDWFKEQGISGTTNNKTNKDEKRFCRKEFNNTTPVCIYINLSAKRKIQQHSSSHHLPINQFGISISTPASYEIADLSGKFGIIENIPQHKLLCSNHRREDWFIMRSPQIEFQPKKKNASNQIWDLFHLRSSRDRFNAEENALKMGDRSSSSSPPTQSALEGESFARGATRSRRQWAPGPDWDLVILRTSIRTSSFSVARGGDDER